MRRDPAADGQFVYAVKTTGVFCHPSCGSRRPRRENVSFFDTAEAALGAGYRPCRRCRPLEGKRDDAALAAMAATLAKHFAEGATLAVLPVDVAGSPFERRVWDVLRTIPAGQTRTYAEVARAAGSPGAARAVGQACAANRLAVVIPCHRVVRADRAAGGYRWGVDRKRALLAREARSAAS